MRPTLLGICTSYKEMLCETVLQVESEEAINLSILLSDLIDQGKSAYTFEEEDWTRFRNEVIKKKPHRGINRKDLEGSMKTHLIRVVHRLTEKSKANLHESIHDPPSWDEDLVLLYRWAEAKALQHGEWKIILRQLDQELEALESRWSSHCPKGDTPITERLLLDCLRNPELSLWSILKASALFASYGPKNGYGYMEVSTRFPWLMAGKQLMRLKADFRDGGSFPHTVVPEMYAILKPDASFVKRLRVENRDDLLEKDMRIESEEEHERRG